MRRLPFGKPDRNVGPCERLTPGVSCPKGGGCFKERPKEQLLLLIFFEKTHLAGYDCGPFRQGLSILAKTFAGPWCTQL